MSGIEGRNPIDDFNTINEELQKFSQKLVEKPMIIIANKMDMPNSKENLKAFKKEVGLPVYEISAINSQGLEDVLIKIANVLDTVEDAPLYEDTEYLSHVLYKFEKEEPYTIEKKDDVFYIKGDEIEKLFKMTKFSSEEGMLRFARKLRKMGIDDKLEAMGAKEGDLVQILNFNFEYRK